MLKLLRTLHRWVGLLTGIFLTLLVSTGALLAASDLGTHFIRSTLPGDPALKNLTINDQAAYVDAIKQHYPKTISIRFPSDQRAYFVALHHGGSLLLDSQLNVVDGDHGPARWIREVIVDFHGQLLIGASGSALTGAVSLATVALVLVGLSLLIPIRRALRIRQLLPANSEAPALIRSHQLWGLLVAVPVVVAALSGASLVWRGPATNLLGTASLPTPSIDLEAPPASRARAIATLATIWPEQRPVGVLIRSARGARPGEILRLDFETAGAAWFEGGDSLTVRLPEATTARVSRLNELPLNAWLLKLLRPLHDGLRLPLWYSFWLLLSMSAACWAFSITTWTMAKRLIPPRRADRPELAG